MFVKKFILFVSIVAWFVATGFVLASQNFTVMVSVSNVPAVLYVLDVKSRLDQWLKPKIERAS